MGMVVTVGQLFSANFRASEIRDAISVSRMLQDPFVFKKFVEALHSWREG